MFLQRATHGYVATTSEKQVPITKLPERQKLQVLEAMANLISPRPVTFNCYAGKNTTNFCKVTT
jgi:hypothetical protein